MPAGILATGLTSLAGSVGITGGLAGILGGGAFADLLAGGLVGAGAGAGSSALFHKDPLLGAATGGLGGLAQGAAPLLGDALGLGTSGLAGILPYALTGAGAGVADAAITGGSLGKGALIGAGGGVLSGGLREVLSPSQSAPAAGGGAAGTSQAAATAVSQGGIPDLTAPGAAGPTPGPISVSDLSAPAGGGGIETIDVTAPRIGGGGGLNLGNAVGGLTAASLSVPSGGDGQSNPSSAGGSLNGGISRPTGSLDLNAPISGVPTATAGPTTSLGKFAASPSVSGFGDVLASNPATLLGLGGLAYQFASQPSKPDQSALLKDVQNNADQLNNQGAQLRNYIFNGQLPPGATAAVNQATNAAKATMKSKFAQLGLSGSTAESTALADIDQRKSAQIFDIANNLLQTGIKESGLSTDLYKSLISDANQQDEEMSSAIANFAASIAGGGSKGLTVNLGGKAA